MTALEIDLRALLNGFVNNVDQINIDLGEKDLAKKLYNKYCFRGVETSNCIDKEIYNIDPFTRLYNKKMLWFKNEKLKFVLPNEEIVGFQDGVNSVFNKGEYLDGGEIYENEFQRETNNPELEGYSKSKNELHKFINVYHPSKVRLSSDNYYYYHYGNYLTRNRNRPRVRIYINIIQNQKLENAEMLINYIIKYLDERHIPFQLKTPNLFSNFNRRDNCVIYLAQSNIFLINELLFNLKEKFKSYINDDLPLFTHKIYPGIGFAEDPFSEESFGEQRCKLIIETIKELKEKNQNPICINSLLSALEVKGYKKECFYKNANTDFTYDFKYINFDLPANIKLFDCKSGYSTFNDFALKYGLELIERAVWFSKDKFGWISFKDGNYSVLNHEESYEIFLFLDCLTRIKENRYFFTKNVLEIIHKNNFEGYTRVDIFESYFRNVLERKNVGEKFELYSNYTNNWYNKIGINTDTISELFSEFKETNKDLKYYLKAIFNPFWSSKNFYDKISRKIEKKDTHELATEILNVFEKKNYPIKNSQNNYEYMPRDKAKIAMILILVACPKVFPKIRQV